MNSIFIKDVILNFCLSCDTSVWRIKLPVSSHTSNNISREIIPDSVVYVAEGEF